MFITAEHLTRKYLLKTALNDVSVRFAEGKIHALVGENGAGKSTLAAILAGDIRPSAGTLCIDGKNTAFSSAKDALAQGIVLVHQRPLLAKNLTVSENIWVSTDSTFFIRPPSAELLALRQTWAPALQLTAYVRDLGGNLRFYASLLGALLKKPRCLILDEPSAFLDMEERKSLYGRLKELAAAGTTIIVITHSTAEALQYADSVTVLSEGALVAQFEGAEAYRAWLENAQRPQAEGAGTGTPRAVQGSSCLKLDHAGARPKNRPALLDASIEAPYGQITCVAGMQEAALGTLEDVVSGMERACTQGSATICSPDGTHSETVQLVHGGLSAAFLRRHRCAIVPSDRTFRAADPHITVEQMLSVYARSGTRQLAQKLIQEAGVNITPEQRVSNLSGGMLQRLILARELSIQPELLILCNPMQGLDIQSQGKLCRTVTGLAAAGTAVLIIGTADFPLSLCSRVYSLEGGKTRLSFSREAQG